MADVAMQVRCLSCLREQWAMVVYPISMGEGVCAWCGQPSTKMTEPQYREALRVARDAHDQQPETD